MTLQEETIKKEEVTKEEKEERLICGLCKFLGIKKFFSFGPDEKYRCPKCGQSEYVYGA